MKKRIISILLAVVLMMASVVTALANDARVLLDGYFLEVNGVIVEGRTLLPVRALSEAVGGEVDWDGELRQVTVTYEKTVILLTIDSHTAYVNGVAELLDVPALIIDGSTFLPLRFIGENLGLAVSWVQEPPTAILRSPNSPFTDEQLGEMALTGER